MSGIDGFESSALQTGNNVFRLKLLARIDVKRRGIKASGPLEDFTVQVLIYQVGIMAIVDERRQGNDDKTKDK